MWALLGYADAKGLLDPKGPFNKTQTGAVGLYSSAKF